MLFRRIKAHIEKENWFAVFIDFLIVVVGVFIGIQVANWNVEKQQQESVESYLKSIARNIESDLTALKITRKKREIAENLSFRKLLFISGKTSFTRDEIAFAGQAFTQAQELHYFNANTSGYEALKTSGVLDRLQGNDIETLLYDYYDTISQIEHDEKNHNDIVKLLWLQFVSKWPKELSQWEFYDPNPLSNSRFQSLQTVYAKILTENSTVAVYEQARYIVKLMQKYERLEQIGKAFIVMVDSKSMNFSATSESLKKLYDSASEIGYANVMVNGQHALHSYNLIAADSNDLKLKGGTEGEVDDGYQQRVSDYQMFDQTDNGLYIAYPGRAEWAGVWIFLEGLDFSSFGTLQIELKGKIGDETLLLNIEDIDDPQDGTSTRYPLKITDEWQTYNIDLAEFKTADFSKLNSLGFVFLEDGAQAFYVRTIRFVE